MLKKAPIAIRILLVGTILVAVPGALTISVVYFLSRKILAHLKMRKAEQYRSVHSNKRRIVKWDQKF